MASPTEAVAHYNDKTVGSTGSLVHSTTEILAPVKEVEDTTAGKSDSFSLTTTQLLSSTNQESGTTPGNNAQISMRKISPKSMHVRKRSTNSNRRGSYKKSIAREKGSMKGKKSYTWQQQKQIASIMNLRKQRMNMWVRPITSSLPCTTAISKASGITQILIVNPNIVENMTLKRHRMAIYKAKLHSKVQNNAFVWKKTSLMTTALPFKEKKYTLAKNNAASKTTNTSPSINLHVNTATTAIPAEVVLPGRKPVKVRNKLAFLDEGISSGFKVPIRSATPSNQAHTTEVWRKQVRLSTSSERSVLQLHVLLLCVTN